MELNENTLSILRNFATINSNIVFEGGNVLKTIADSKTVLSKAELDQSFPQSFGIYDLGEFLSVLGLVDSPVLSFGESSVSVSDGSGRSNIKYFYSPIDHLTTPTKDIPMPEYDVTFTLDRSTMAKIKRAASTLGFEEVSVTSIDGVIVLKVFDMNDPTSNSYTVEVDGSAESSNFNFVFNINNLKMIDGDYVVGLSRKNLSHFVNKESNVEYWVALQKSSKFEEE